MDRPEPRCPPQGSLRLLVLTSLLPVYEVFFTNCGYSCFGRLLSHLCSRESEWRRVVATNGALNTEVTRNNNFQSNRGSGSDHSDSSSDPYLLVDESMAFPVGSQNSLQTLFTPLEDKGHPGILTAVLTYPMLRTFSLWLHSSITGSYISGSYSIVFVNCPNEQIARDIARAILDKKMASSVNILPKTSSLYFWKGEIEEGTEVSLLIKTKTSKVSRLFAYMRLAHPFEIPEAFSIPMDQGDARYLQWLEEGMKEN